MPTEPRPREGGIAEAFAALAAAQERLRSEWLHRFGTVPGADALIQALVRAARRDPERLQALNARYRAEQLALWRRFAAPEAEPADLPEPEPDPRFAAPEWREIPWFDYLRRGYALFSRWLRELVDLIDADDPMRRSLVFHAAQFLSAIAPSNYAATNPEALRIAFETGGESFARGLANLLHDSARGQVTMTDGSAFEVGRNIAVTPGAVVYRNDLIELLRYRPLAGRVQRRPLVIVPPCINKYYILDLRPENSFVRYALAGGLDVFMVSWRNVPRGLGHLTWDDYLTQGVIPAIDVARSLAGADKVNALGFCVGGTLLACALAVLRRQRRRPAASLTLLASLLDFAEPGDIGVYIDEASVAATERELGAGGVLPGSRLAAAFASLRPDDLVWRYVVENYLKGRTPPAFDLLHWNSDSANLPGPMYAYYLRNMYLENRLCRPDALTMCGVPVDIGRIGLPSYVLATEADHIVPWRSAYAGARLLGGAVTFVLGGSGHIAGVVNSPQPPRRHYRSGTIDAAGPDSWLARAEQHRGSWWLHWLAWIARHAGGERAAPVALGSTRHPELEPAPGRYVREQAIQP